MKQLAQGDTAVLHPTVGEIVVEHAIVAENARVLGIQAEYQPHAEHIQAFQRALVGGILILRQEGIVELAHQLARLHGDFHFALNLLVAGVHQKIQAAIFLFQIRKAQNLRRFVGAVHIVNVEFLKIAHDNPARVLIVRKKARIAPRLLKRREHGAVGLLIALAQINVLPLLLNQDAGGLDQTVDKAGVTQLHGNLKFDEFVRLGYAINPLQKRHPEGLRFLLFIAATLPACGKLLRGRSFFHIGHDVPSRVRLL